MRVIVKRMIEAAESRHYRTVEPGANWGGNRPSPYDFVARRERECKIRADKRCGCRQYYDDESKSWVNLDYCWVHLLAD